MKNKNLQKLKEMGPIEFIEKVLGVKGLSKTQKNLLDKPNAKFIIKPYEHRIFHLSEVSRLLNECPYKTIYRELGLQ